MEKSPTRAIDPSLIARLSAGDSAAFRQVFDLYHQKLYAFSLKFTKSRVGSGKFATERLRG
jgi:DNA-directed RNA polymerase specialized sigma24 family protein